MILIFKRVIGSIDQTMEPCYRLEKISIPIKRPNIVSRWILCYLLDCKISDQDDFSEVENQSGFDYLDKM